MRTLSSILRHYPLTAICIAAIWFLSFFTPPHTPLDNVSFIDKWTHIVMYGGTCAVIWFETLRSGKRHSWRRLVFWTWIAPILLGCLIEILQAYCTGGRRSGDWLDAVANASGATLAAIAGFILLRHRSRKNKGGC